MQYLLRKVDCDGEGGLAGRIYHVCGAGRNVNDAALGKVD